jgi:hypothetical protein
MPQTADRSADVSLIAIFTSISTLCSMIQQVHYALDWQSIRIAEWLASTDTEALPAFRLVGVADKMDIVLFVIRTSSITDTIQAANSSVKNTIVITWRPYSLPAG